MKKRIFSLMLAMAMMLSMVVNVCAEEWIFDDLPYTQENIKYAHLKKTGICRGTPDGANTYIYPEKIVTNEEVFVWIGRTLGYANDNGDPLRYQKAGIDATFSAAERLNELYRLISEAKWSTGELGYIIQLPIAKELIYALATDYNVDDYADWSYSDFTENTLEIFTANYTSPIYWSDAIRLLVRLLGYEEQAVSEGGMPYGYISVANRLGILNGTNLASKHYMDSMTREEMATIFYNAIHTPLCLSQKELSTGMRDAKRMGADCPAEITEICDGTGASGKYETIYKFGRYENLSTFGYDGNDPVQLATPSVMANEPIYIKAGETIDFSWLPVANADYYTVWDWTRNMPYDFINGTSFNGIAPYTEPGTYAIGVYARSYNRQDYRQSEAYSFNVVVEPATGSFSPTPQQSDIDVTVNGNYINFDVPPQIINDRTMVPLRAIFEALGCEVKWIGEEQKVIARNEERYIEIVIGEPTMVVQSLNGDGPSGWTYLDSPAVIIDGRTLVPARAVAEAFMCEVEWDEATRSVIIEK